MKAQGINNSDLKVKGPTKNNKSKNAKQLGLPNNSYARDAVITRGITSSGCDF